VHVRADHGMRTDRRPLADPGARIDDGGRIDRGLVGDEAEGATFSRSELWVERGGRLVTPLSPPS